MAFDKEQQAHWMDDKAETLLREHQDEILKVLPPEMQLAIRSLVRRGVQTGYNWGLQHGRSYAGSAIEPTYYVPEPTVRIIAESRDVA